MEDKIILKKSEKEVEKLEKNAENKFIINKNGSIRDGFGKGLLECAKNNENVVVLCADLTDSLKLGEFKKNFSNRFYEMGIAEQNMMGAAAGMCLNNKIPFVVSYAVFNPGRNWDQLRVSVCYSNHNVKIIGGHAGLTTGPDGATHQALEDIAITRVLPNLTVIVPCDELEAKKAVVEMIKHKGPVYLRLTREKSEILTEDSTPFKIGKINKLKEGKDITIFTNGLCLQYVVKAYEELKKLNISVSIINVHTIKPLDKDNILSELRKTNLALIVEEHQKIGGLGSAICELSCENYPVLMEIIGVDDKFGESGDGYELLEKHGINVQNIVNKCVELIKRKNSNM